MDRALDWIGLADRADSLVGTLSGGQQRRVNLAAGTLHEPGLLVLDEPTVGLDPQVRQELWALIDALRAEGVSEERLRAIHAPVGLDLGGRTPAEIALSVMSEITAIRYHGTGKALCRWDA